MATHSPVTNKRAIRYGIWLAGAISLAGLIVTALAACFAKRELETAAKREFEFLCDEIRTKIQDRFDAHEQILRSGAAFCEASDSVTRQKWCQFTERQKLEQELPGIQGFGFALLISGQQLDQHVQEIRAEGFPDYHIRPEGKRDTYSSIIYLEPFADRNLRAFGYDMLTEPVRREAMERARDQNTASLSGKVKLVQETDKDVQAGTLMYVPVYCAGMPRETVAQRRAAVLGWVYSPYRMNDLMRGILGGRDSEINKRIHLEVFDGEKVSPETLLYDSQSAGGNARASASALALQIPVDTAGRRWTLSFSQSGNLAAAVDYSRVWFVSLGGTSVSLLLFGLSLSLWNTQSNAWQIAQELTAEYERVENALRHTTDRLSLAARAGGVGIWDYDVVNNKLAWDDQMFRLYGITREQFGGAYEAWQAGVHPDDRQRGDEEIQSGLRGEKDFNTTFRVLWPDGSVHYVRALALVQRDACGNPVQMIGTNWDITAQQQAEAALRESEENFRTCFTSIGDMMAVVAPGGQLLYGNTAFMHRLGYSLQEVLDLHVLDVHPADVRDEAAGIFGAMLRGDRKSCPLPWITKNGELIPVETRIWPGKWNGKDCIYGVGKDLTEQQAALQMFEKVFEANPAPMALSRLPDRTLVKVNQAFSTVTGYGRDEAIGKTSADLSLFANHDDSLAVGEKLTAEGSVRGMALTLRTKDGKLCHGLFFGEVVQSQGVSYFLTTMVDISPQKEIERQLRETQQSLEERVQSRTVELQTLNEALLDENTRRRQIEASLQEQQHNLRRLASQLTLAEEAQRHELAVQLHDTIGQELAMARLRLEHARGTPSDERDQNFGIAAELLDAAIGHVQRLTHGLGASVLYQLGLPAALRSIGSQVSEQHNLQFTFHQEGDYRRSGKETEVHAFRMARELIYNAVKHAYASRLDVTLSATADAITVCVEDNGAGFVPEVGLKKNSDVGSGFGLFSIRERLAILGGRLKLLSSPGQGTVATVIITLPNDSPAATESGT